MNIKQKAALQTVGILTVIVGASLAVTLILENFTAQQIATGFGILSILCLIYAMYGVVLSRLEYEATLKKLVDIRND